MVRDRALAKIDDGDGAKSLGTPLTPGRQLVDGSEARRPGPRGQGRGPLHPRPRPDPALRSYLARGPRACRIAPEIGRFRPCTCQRDGRGAAIGRLERERTANPRPITAAFGRTMLLGHAVGRVETSTVERLDGGGRSDQRCGESRVGGFLHFNCDPRAIRDMTGSTGARRRLRDTRNREIAHTGTLWRMRARKVLRVEGPTSDRARTLKNVDRRGRAEIQESG